MGAIYAAFRYGSGDVPQPAALAKHATLPLDGKCSIDLPGEPLAEDVPADVFSLRLPVAMGGKRLRRGRQRFRAR